MASNKVISFRDFERVREQELAASHEKYRETHGYDSDDYDSDDYDSDDYDDYGMNCEHKKEEINRTVFCVKCGLEFNELVPIPRSLRSTEISDHHVMREDEDEEPQPPPPSPEPEPTTVTCVKDLKALAKSRGIKYYSRISKEELCKVLNAKTVKPFKIIFVNKETEQEQGFHSLNQAAKELKVNPGLIHYHMGNEMTIGDVTYQIVKN